MEERKKKLLAGLLALLAVAVLVTGGYQAWLRIPPELPEDVDGVESLLASSRYQRLSKQDKQPYQDRINEMWGGLSPEERKRLGDVYKTNADARQEAQASFLQGASTMYKAMYLLQSEQVRQNNMDMMIDRGRGDNNANESASDYASREKTSEEQEQEREFIRQLFEVLDTGDAQSLGYMSEMGKMMQQRREERGLPPW